MSATFTNAASRGSSTFTNAASRGSSTFKRSDGLSSSTPAQSATQLKALYPSVTDGNYWYKPAGYSGAAVQLYTNFTNAPSGKGLVLVARGRESTNWWDNNGQNTGGLTSTDLSVNTPIAVLPSTFVNSLIGGAWSALRMRVNRLNASDSVYIQGTQGGVAFQWYGYFAAAIDTNSPGATATGTVYTNQWLGGAIKSGPSTVWTDFGAANDCTRSFTWWWSGHGSYQGWSGGQTCTPAGSFQAAGEGHAIELVNVYVEC